MPDNIMQMKCQAQALPLANSGSRWITVGHDNKTRTYGL
jgi:hypothetical protein